MSASRCSVVHQYESVGVRNRHSWYRDSHRPFYLLFKLTGASPLALWISRNSGLHLEIYYVLWSVECLLLLRVLCTTCTKWMHIRLTMSACLSVCPHDSTRTPLDGFGLNLVWTLCHWRLPLTRPFNFLQLVIPPCQTNELMSRGLQ